jgi:hypothetical protein
MKKEYFGIALSLVDEKSMLCLLQEGTDNTIKNSNLVTHTFPYSAMKKIIKNRINLEGMVMPQQYFKVEITEEENFISYKFSSVEVTDELKKLMEMPDYFADLKDTAFFNRDDE